MNEQDLMYSETIKLVLDKQKEFQKDFGFNKEDTDVAQVSDLIHTHSYFAIEEILEMLRELPYHKPWKDYSDWDAQKMAEQFSKVEEEWTDVFIFIMNVAVFLNFDEAKIRELFLKKNGVNMERQENPELGYVNG